MRGDLLGGGVVVAVAAALWLIYLVPTWLHRREYLATERNAVRLQQTLRILAETAETPHQVRVEATAREVARQRRVLKTAQRRVAAVSKEESRREAVELADRQLRAERERRVQERERAQASAAQKVRREAVAHAAPTEGGPTPSRMQTADGAHRTAQKRRRMRAGSSLLLLASVTAVVWGTVALATGGSWFLLLGGVMGFGGALVALRRLARPQAHVVVPVAAATQAATELFDQADHDVPAPSRQASSWTPRPLPKPLHLSRGTVAASAMASVDAAVELRRAAVRAELERRAENVEPELPRLRPVATVQQPARAVEPEVAAATGTDGRYAAMGVVDAVGDGRLDLDAVLRRRRG